MLFSLIIVPFGYKKKSIPEKIIFLTAGKVIYREHDSEKFYRTEKGAATLFLCDGSFYHT